MEYHLALKNKKIVSYVITWMNTEGIVLSGMTAPEGRTLHDTIHIGYENQAYSLNHRADWWLLEEWAWGVTI